MKDAINGRVQKVKLEFKISCGHNFRAVRVKSKPTPKIRNMGGKIKIRKKMPSRINQFNTADFTKLQIVIFI